MEYQQCFEASATLFLHTEHVPAISELLRLFAVLVAVRADPIAQPGPGRSSPRCWKNGAESPGV